MGIKVTSGFDLNAPQLLDSKAKQASLDDMKALITNNEVVEGQLCYCTSDSVVYVLKNVNDALGWYPVASSASYDSKIKALEDLVSQLSTALNDFKQNVAENYVPKTDIKNYTGTYDSGNLNIESYYTFDDTTDTTN